MYCILTQEYLEYTSTHPLKACRCPIVVTPIILFSDDTSGNMSIKWNKCDSWCMTLAGLPLCMVDKPHHLHSISCSNNVSALDMSAPLIKDLFKLENGVYMYDASKEEQVLVFAPVMSIL